MELGGGGGGGGGGFWDLSSALYPAPHLLPFNQHETMVLHGGFQGMPAMDPHLTCLKLGKRHYFEDAGERPHPSVDHLLGGKKGRGFGGGSSSLSPAAAAVPVPRCQVEGCSMLLVHAKDYHRRHKVCETHSKAPKVVVLGLEQRFCQQCSRSATLFLLHLLLLQVFFGYDLLSLKEGLLQVSCGVRV